MAQVTPADIPLPAFLDPLLDYLADSLPSPIYSFIISFASHCLAALSAGLTLIGALTSTHPSQWNMQTVLPPLIAVLSAYLALISLYRTTSWMIRTSFWFIKWGTILAFLAGGAGWIMGGGAGAGGNALGLPNLGSAIGGLVLDMMNGGEGTGRGRQHGQSERNPRPKPWDSFKQHDAWQYNERAGGPRGGEAQVGLQDILAAAKDSGFWSALKGTYESFQDQREERQRPAKERQGRSTSR